MWGEAVEECSDAAPCIFGGALSGAPEHELKLGKDLLDWVQVGGVGRQEEQLCACCPDGFPDADALVTAQIVHDDDIARREGGNEELLDPGGKALCVDGTIEHARGIDPIGAKGRDKGQRRPFAKWRPADEPGSALAPPPDRRHVGLGPCLIDEDQP